MTLRREKRLKMNVSAVRRSPEGFSMVELLVVIAIVAILTGLLVPSINSQLGARNLESAGQILSDLLSIARQEAVARNRGVDFRIYRFQDKDEAGSAAEMRGFQLFAMENDGSKIPISKMVYLPAGISISEKPEMTSLISLAEKQPGNGDPKVPRAAGAYTFRSFEFRPDGSTDLAYGSKHFVTVRESKDDQTPPKNYVTILIESATGRTQAFRP